MIQHGYFLLFGDKRVAISEDIELAVKMTRNRWFPLIIKDMSPTTLKIIIEYDVWEWHKMFDHLNFKSLQMLAYEEMVHSLTKLRKSNVVCERCVAGKQHREVFCKEMAAVKSTLYWSLLYRSFKTFVRIWDLKDGDAERKNKTIVENGCEEYTSFCREVVNTVMYILNKCPTKALENKTLFKALCGKKPGIKHLKVFGGMCYCHIPGLLRQKLDEASIKRIFVGLWETEKGYMIYNLTTMKIFLVKKCGI